MDADILYSDTGPRAVRKRVEATPTVPGKLSLLPIWEPTLGDELIRTMPILWVSVCNSMWDSHNSLQHHLVSLVTVL